MSLLTRVLRSFRTNISPSLPNETPSESIEIELTRDWYPSTVQDADTSLRSTGSDANPEIVHSFRCRNCKRSISAKGPFVRYKHDHNGSIYCDPAEAAIREWYIRSVQPQAEIEATGA